jgi:hypothetical protein
VIGARPVILRRRPLWLVAALTVFSLGVYLPIWIGFTWSELRRENGDERMRPVWHALSLFVPGYGYWQVYRHFSYIGERLVRVGASMRVDPISATLGVVVWSLTFFHYSTELLFALLDGVELAAGTAVVVYGQHALNTFWRTRPGPPVEERVLDTDWLALAVAGVYFVLALMSYASGPSN